MSIIDDASSMLTSAHKALLQHQALATRLADDVETLESLLASKRVELKRAHEQQEGFRDTVREAFDFYKFAVAQPRVDRREAAEHPFDSLSSMAEVARRQRGCPESCGCTDCDLAGDLRQLAAK